MCSGVRPHSDMPCLQMTQDPATRRARLSYAATTTALHPFVRSRRRDCAGISRLAVAQRWVALVERVWILCGVLSRSSDAGCHGASFAPFAVTTDDDQAHSWRDSVMCATYSYWYHRNERSIHQNVHCRNARPLVCVRGVLPQRRRWHGHCFLHAHT